jgi:AcrR family transcriptional regulator
MVQTARSEKSAEARRMEILGATLDLVAVRGGDNVRLRDVAGATGLSVGTLQHYFETRDNLLEEAFLLHHTAIIDSLQSANDPTLDPWTRIQRMIETVTPADRLKFRSSAWVELVSQAGRLERLGDAARETYEAWRAMFEAAAEQGIEQGIFSPRLPTHAAISALMAAVDGYEIVLVLGIGDTSAESIRASLVQLAEALLGVDSATTDVER